LSVLPVTCRAPGEATLCALRALCNEFYWLVDHGYADRTRHLFTENVCYEAQGIATVGIDALMERMKARAQRRKPETRHDAAAFRFHQEDAASVAGYSMLIVYRGAPTPAVIADVHDLFRCGADGLWRIARRRIVQVMANGPAGEKKA
jgi:hypothetical protein